MPIDPIPNTKSQKTNANLTNSKKQKIHNEKFESLHEGLIF
jgi:hypothetical protein